MGKVRCALVRCGIASNGKARFVHGWVGDFLRARSGKVWRGEVSPADLRSGALMRGVVRSGIPRRGMAGFVHRVGTVSRSTGGVRLGDAW